MGRGGSSIIFRVQFFKASIDEQTCGQTNRSPLGESFSGGAVDGDGVIVAVLASAGY